jgi:hypothetical protein
MRFLEQAPNNFRKSAAKINETALGHMLPAWIWKASS